MSHTKTKSVVVVLYANPKTLSAFQAIFIFSWISFFFSSGVSFVILSWIWICVHMFKIISGEPFKYSIHLCWVIIIFVAESNGISPIFFCHHLIHPCKLTSSRANSVGSQILGKTALLQLLAISKSNFNSSWLIFSSLMEKYHLSSIWCTFMMWSFANISVTVIWFCVSVPVLSEQITVVLPRVSIAFIFLTSTFFLYIVCTHRARVIVTTAGNHSGIAETARLIEVRSISSHGRCLNVPTTNIIQQIINIIIPSCIHKVFNFFWSGVALSSVFSTIFAIFPSSVCIQVSVTIPVTFPVVIVVPEKSMFVLSQSGTIHSTMSALLFTGTLSQVRIDSSAARTKLSMILISAHTLSPASSKMISPGTSSLAGMICCIPFLITFTVGELNLLSIWIALSALYSWKNHISAFKMMIAVMIYASVNSRRKKLSRAAQISTITIGSVNWEKNILSMVKCFVCLSSLLPCIFNFLFISWKVSHSLRDQSSWRMVLMGFW